MKNRIFRGMVISSVLVWVLCTAVIAGYFYSVYSGQSFENMEKDAGIIGQGVENFGEDYLRQGRRNLDGYRIYKNAIGEQDNLSDLFDAAEILDPERPPVPDL